MRPDWLNVTLWHAGMPVEQAIDCLEQFAEEVLPEIARVQPTSEPAQP